MKKRLLIIGFVWPEPKSSAAGSRMMQLINCFLTQGYHITFASPSQRSEKAFNLNTLGIDQVDILLNDSSFDDFIKLLNPDVVLFDRFMMEEQFGWRVAEHCPKAIRILDTEDLHFLRKGRQQAFKDKQAFDDSYVFNETAKREIASIYRCDLSLLISKAEMELLKTRFKMEDSILMYLPFMFNEVSLEALNTFPKFEERHHFITIGNFLHEPNYNAVLYLKESIWPLIRQQLPKAEMHIYGAYATQKVYQLHNKNENFLIQGFAEDVNQVMQKAKVCLAPIRFGAGLKGKLVDAIQNGTPSVTTSIGAEGMHELIEASGCIQDESEAFAESAAQLYSDKSIWEQKQNKGFQLFNNYFSKKEHESNFIKRLDQIANDLKTHRFLNFTGQILQHHTLQSTKFMSKWIEVKNKN